jgi:hypothetical protein
MLPLRLAITLTYMHDTKELANGWIELKLKLILNAPSSLTQDLGAKQARRCRETSLLNALQRTVDFAE